MLKASPPLIRNEAKISVHTTSIHHCTGHSCQSKKARKYKASRLERSKCLSLQMTELITENFKEYTLKNKSY